ncbi:hypothetical protein QJUYFBOH_CDS0088 [Escherichia phage SHIN8]
MDSFGRITILAVTDRSNEPAHRPHLGSSGY